MKIIIENIKTNYWGLHRRLLNASMKKGYIEKLVLRNCIITEIEDLKYFFIKTKIKGRYHCFITGVLVLDSVIDSNVFEGKRYEN